MQLWGEEEGRDRDDMTGGFRFIFFKFIFFFFLWPPTHLFQGGKVARRENYVCLIAVILEIPYSTD